MRILKALLTPAGAAAMVVALWLPWANVSCQQVRVNPTYWQLSEYDHRLYALAVLVALVALGWVWFAWQRRMVAVVSTFVTSLAAAVAWCYLWIKRDDLAAHQAEMSNASGELGRMFQDLDVQTGSGFKLYLAGALVALAGSAWVWSQKRKSGPGT